MGTYSSDKTTPVAVRTIGEVLLGVYWLEEYYPVEVKSSRLSKDCRNRIYRVSSEGHLLTLLQDQITGAWMVEVRS